MDNVVLIGPRLVGKTTIGKIVRKMIGGGFIDSDREFEIRYGAIGDIVKSKGWQGFRKLESEVIEDICAARYQHRVVLSLGGGSVSHSDVEEYRAKNASLVREFGSVFYLLPFNNLSKSALFLDERQKEDADVLGRRPSLGKTTLETLRERHPIHKSAAHFTILTGHYDSSGVAKLITEQLESV